MNATRRADGAALHALLLARTASRTAATTRAPPTSRRSRARCCASRGSRGSCAAARRCCRSRSRAASSTSTTPTRCCARATAASTGHQDGLHRRRRALLRRHRAPRPGASSASCCCTRPIPAAQARQLLDRGFRGRAGLVGALLGEQADLLDLRVLDGQHLESGRVPTRDLLAGLGQPPEVLEDRRRRSSPRGGRRGRCRGAPRRAAPAPSRRAPCPRLLAQTARAPRGSNSSSISPTISSRTSSSVISPTDGAVLVDHEREVLAQLAQALEELVDQHRLRHALERPGERLERVVACARRPAGP